MPDRRALPATARSMDCVDRSGNTVIAPLHLPLPQHRVCTCSLVFSFQVSDMIAVQHSAVQKRRARGELSLGFCFTFAYRIKQILRYLGHGAISMHPVKAAPGIAAMRTPCTNEHGKYAEVRSIILVILPDVFGKAFDIRQAEIMGRRHCFDVFLMRRWFQHSSLMEVLILPEQLIYRNLSLCAEQQSAIKYNRACPV